MKTVEFQQGNTKIKAYSDYTYQKEHPTAISKNSGLKELYTEQEKYLLSIF
jgi:hypothetical protein